MHNVENEHLINALAFVRRNPKATLFDIDGMIGEVACVDEGAARFLQKRLRLGTVEEKNLCMTAVLADFDVLWQDHYGNFMLRGIFEFGSTEMKQELMVAIYDFDVVAFCMHIHGCRVIQKAILCLDQEQVCKLVSAFQDKVLTFIHDPNGNHIIQRSIQVMSGFAKAAPTNDSGQEDQELTSSLSDQMQFIVDDIMENVEMLSTHRYGCRVVQRAVQHCVDLQKHAVLERIISCHEKLIVDQYGNYVIQQVFKCGDEEHQTAILKTLIENDSLLILAKHKYASNVIESVLVNGKAHHKRKIVEEMLKDTREKAGGYCCLIELSKDSIANYVVNAAIENSEKDLQEKLFEVISSAREELNNSQYAKYVLARIDKRDKEYNSKK